MKLELSEAAEQEIAVAIDWYNDQRPALGAEFLDSLEILLVSIETAPESFARLEGYRGSRHLRRGLLQRFPYKIIFEVRPNQQLVVLAVAHTSRRPNYWQGRLG